MVVSVYIDNPMLIDGFKFDLRVYVALTSINPLRIYIYEDGLARFATQKYKQNSTKQDKYVHLTNYSLNKNSATFQNNTDATKDDQGSKWSIAALMKRLAKMGHDTQLLWCKIEDLVIKTIISGEHVINNATEMFCPFPRTACFELFGFDVLIDSNLEPWLLEVNLTPAMGCDSPLDQKIKANVVADLFSLAGVVQLEHRLMEPTQYKKASVHNGLLSQYTK
jgi:Tubulin-tyrosine ligase family